MPATNAAPTVTHAAEVPSTALEEPGAAPAAPAEVQIPESMRYAVAAAEGLSEGALLGLAQCAALARHPLLAAFACQRLHAATLLMDKAAWQQLVVQVGRQGWAQDWGIRVVCAAGLGARLGHMGGAAVWWLAYLLGDALRQLQQVKWEPALKDCRCCPLPCCRCLALAWPQTSTQTTLLSCSR